MIQMNYTTKYDGKNYIKGKTYNDLPKEVEERWKERGLAAAVKSAKDNTGKDQKENVN